MFMAKAWVAFLMSMLTAMSTALSDDYLDASDTQQVLVALVGGGITLYTVYQTRNRPSDRV